MLPPARPVTVQHWGLFWSCATVGKNPEPVCRASASLCHRQSLRLTLVITLMLLQRSSKCQQGTMVSGIVILKKKRFCLSDRPHLLLLFLHLTTSDLGFLLFFYVSDMKTRKWSFSLEDYKQLSKCVCLCVFFLGDICHLVWPCCVPYPVDRLSGIAAVEVEPLPRALIQAFSARFEGRTDAMAVDVPVADLSTIDPTLTSSLMPFQREGVK